MNNVTDIIPVMASQIFTDYISKYKNFAAMFLMSDTI